MFDFDDQMDPEDIKLCPLCDGPMFEFDEVTVIKAGGAKCLAHYSCVQDRLPVEIDEDEE